MIKRERERPSRIAKRKHKVLEEDAAFPAALSIHLNMCAEKKQIGRGY